MASESAACPECGNHRAGWEKYDHCPVCADRRAQAAITVTVHDTRESFYGALGVPLPEPPEADDAN